MMLSQSLSPAYFHHSLLPVSIPPTNRVPFLLQRNSCISSLSRVRILGRQISRRAQRALGKEHGVDYDEEAMMEAEEGMEGGGKGNYANYAAFLEEAFKDDRELQGIIGDMIGDPEEMQKKVHERFKRKEKDILQPKTGSPLPMKVSFIDFDATDSYIWIELYNNPSEKEIDIIGSVIRSWYLLGCLGGYNSLNMQLTRIPVNERLSYNENVNDEFLPARFHNIGELEFQHNWGRFWVDLGTSDPLALDVFINGFISVSSDYVGIKQLTFGGKDLGNWNEDLESVSEEDGYKSFKI